MSYMVHGHWFAVLSVILYFFPSQDALQLLVVLPQATKSQTAAATSYPWQELLAEAERAVNNINHNYSIQNKKNVNFDTLEILVVRDDACYYPYLAESILPQFINYTLYQESQNAIIGAVGFFCPHSAKLVARLVQRKRLQKFNFPLISGSSLTELNDDKFTNVFHILDSLNGIGRTLVSFMQYQRWTRLSVITDIESNIYSQTAEQLSKFVSEKSDIIISKYMQVDQALDFTLGTFDARVVFVSMSETRTVKLLCDAYQHGLMWPTHAWIVQLKQPLQVGEKAVDFDNLDGVFVIQSTNAGHNADNKPSVDYHCNMSKSYYANLICDSINVAALIYNHCLFNNSCTSYIDALKSITYASYEVGPLKFNETTQTLFSPGVDILQILNGHAIGIGRYDAVLNKFHINNDSIKVNDIPPGRMYRAHSIIVLVVYYTAIIFGFTVLTVNFVVFIYCRKEPEVKATSFSVTFFIFLSCYIIVIYLILVTLKEKLVRPSTFSDVLCIGRSWLNVLSLSAPLITATTLVKMLRIYKIFHSTNLARKGKCFSSPALACFILVLQIPNVLITLIWTITDPYLNRVTETQLTNFVLTIDECYSNRVKTWTSLLFAYNLLLGFILIVVAVKTRKIRRRNFKDTKKVNAFIFVFTFVGTLGLIIWLLVRSISMTTTPDVILYVLHVLMLLITQGFLITPKLLPALNRSILHRKMNAQKQNKTGVSLSSLNIASQYTSFTSLLK